MPIAECGPPSAPAGVSPQQLLVHIGPTLAVDIGFDPTVYVSSSAAGGALPVPQSGATQVPALVDTGATESCIDVALAQQLNLPIVDRRKVAGVGGTHTVDMYLAHIMVPSLGHIQYGQFAGVSLSAGGQPHIALIGRSFLMDMILIYDGRTGQVQLAK